ncbi:MAG: hypothetical protein RJA99_4591 [Pseudomonadota bacterium]|jgi:general secretion pathway protein C
MRLRLPLARIVTVLLCAALGAIVAAWALALLAPRPPIAPAGAVAAQQGAADLGAASQLFGGVPQAASAPASSAPSNIQVAGVLAAAGRGVALLAVDGRPAKPFAVGEPVADGLRVRSVTGDSVELELERGGAGAPVRLAAPPRGSVAVLTGGPQRGASGATAPPVGGLPIAPPPTPLPPRPLPPAGAAADPGVAAGVPVAPAVDPNAAALAAGAVRMPGLAPGAPPGAQ